MSVSSNDSGWVSPSPRTGVNESRATRGMRGMLGRPDQADLVTRGDEALLEDRRVPARVFGMSPGRDPAVAAVDEPARLGVARRRVVRQLDERAGAADAHPVAVPQRGPVEAGKRQVLAIGAGESLVPVGPDALDGLAV